MDKHDKEFEAYLRQFRLRQPGPPPEMASVSPRGSMRWLIAAAVVVLTVGVSVVLVRNSGSGGGPKATVEAAGSPSLYRAGETIEMGRVVQSNSAVGLVLALEDGSRVEMREQSELKLESADDGIRVRLNDGSVMVTAAKQASGRHLYVQTRDAMVSVVGTVFLVTAEQSGTSVAVVEGEVHVQQETGLKKLLPGEQLATNPSMQLKPVAEQISWSRRAVEYVALLQQPATPIAPLTTEPVVSSQAAPAQPLKLNGIDYNDIDSPVFTRPSSNQLPFRVQASYVRITADEVRTLITIQFMNRDLAFSDEGGGKRARVRIDGEIYRIDNRWLGGISSEVLQEFPSNNLAANLDQPVLFQETRYLTPGKYKVHITAEDLNSRSAGVVDYVLNVPRIPDQTLQASSMILAYSITDLPSRGAGVEPFALGDKKVMPNVTGIFKRDQSLNIWQEIYGLTVDKTTREPSATFELVISQNNREIKKLVSESSELTGSGLQMKYTNSVPLGSFAPGAYDVQVKVTDNLAKVSFASTGRFTVAGPSVQTEPVRITSGKQIFDRECTSCHSADVAMKMGTMGVPLSTRERSTLSFIHDQIPALLSDGRTGEVIRLQRSIGELELTRNYRSYVSRHLGGFGKTPSTEELLILAGYHYAEMSSKLEMQGASQPQDRPVTPPVQPVQPNDKDAPKEDPDVAGARILNSACTSCHDLGVTTGRKEDRASWERIVNGMVGYGASVKDTELPVLVDYLFRRYGPPRPRP
jgi:cytochrome c5